MGWGGGGSGGGAVMTALMHPSTAVDVISPDRAFARIDVPPCVLVVILISCCVGSMSSFAGRNIRPGNVA